MIGFLVLVASSISHLVRFGFPSSVVFDEVYYGNFLFYYWQGTYFFDQHPPFFKLLTAFAGQALDLEGYLANWDTIGNVLPAELLVIRLIPLVAGIILPLIIYAICRCLNFSKTVSLLVASLIILENSLIVQSRYILPDLVMITIGFSALLFYLESNKQNGKRADWFLALSTILAALALSTKWTGLTFLFLILVMESYKLLTQSLKINEFVKKISLFSLKYLVVSLVIYISLFFIHFQALPNSGPGDVFMSESFQKTLIGNEHNKNITGQSSVGFWDKFFELNKVMYSANAQMVATHPYSSPWYSWPFMTRTVFYWQGSIEPESTLRSYIYFIGNPIVYWLGSLAAMAVIMYGLLRLRSGKLLTNEPLHLKIILFIVVGYLVNLLPFMLIGRVMFLYHYQVSLIFSIIALGYLVDKLKIKQKTSTVIVLITISAFAFMYWSPLTYGTQLTDEQINSRMWLKTWR